MAGLEPDHQHRRLHPPAQHPQTRLDQDYYVSWNDQQAEDFAAASYGDGSVYRANLFDARVKKLVSSFFTRLSNRFTRYTEPSP